MDVRPMSVFIFIAGGLLGSIVTQVVSTGTILQQRHHPTVMSSTSTACNSHEIPGLFSPSIARSNYNGTNNANF